MDTKPSFITEIVKYFINMKLGRCINYQIITGTVAWCDNFTKFKSFEFKIKIPLYVHNTFVCMLYIILNEKSCLTFCRNMENNPVSE